MRWHFRMKSICLGCLYLGRSPTWRLLRYPAPSDLSILKETQPALSLPRPRSFVSDYRVLDAGNLSWERATRLPSPQLHIMRYCTRTHRCTLSPLFFAWLKPWRSDIWLPCFIILTVVLDTHSASSIPLFPQRKRDSEMEIYVWSTSLSLTIQFVVVLAMMGHHFPFCKILLTLYYGWSLFQWKSIRNYRFSGLNHLHSNPAHCSRSRRKLNLSSQQKYNSIW